MTAHPSSILAGMWLAFVSIGVCRACGAEPGGPGAAPFDPARLLPFLDANRDGGLSKEEFRNLASLGQGRVQDRPEVLDRIFERLDADRSGGLSPDEFKELSGLRGHAQPKPSVPVTPKAGLSKLYKPADGPHGVESSPDLVLRDDTRGKDLQLRVGFPQDGAPFPVIVFAHGATASKDDYQPLVRHWVSHGYVCIQANHSDSRALTGKSMTGGPPAEVFGDWANRPKDIAFILDSLDAIEAKVAGLKGKMDKTSIGVGGHSFGAHTAQLVAGATTLGLGGARSRHADPRPQAFVLISPQGRGPQLDDKSWNDLTRPFLSVTGSNDWGRNADPVDWRLDPYRFAASPAKYLLYIDGAHHDFGGIGGGVQYRNAGPANPNHLAYVKSTTTVFWDAYLKGDREARGYLGSGTVGELSEGEARLTKAH